MKRTELDLSKSEYDMVLDELKGLLKEKKLPLEQVVNAISLTEEKTIKVIRWLLDNNTLVREDKNSLRWKD